MTASDDSITPAAFASGKDETGENFPVASRLIAARHRPLVIAFYRVARMADDVADHEHLTSAQKLDQLARIEASLLGEDAGVPQAVALRAALAERQVTDRHMLDLLEAFRRDAVKNRYATWDELMDYCRYSAAPVGRFMLDVHGEARSTWEASDALCAALQVINHLQDCGKDYRDIDRVYIPLDELAAAGASVEDIGAETASPALRQVIVSLAARTAALLARADGFAAEVRDFGLALEVGVIHALARDLTARLQRFDPLSERVHHRRPAMAGLALAGAGSVILSRLGLGKPAELGHR